MTRKYYQRLLRAALLLLTFWQAVACHQVVNPVSQTDCHLVEHAAGETCVPNHLQRVVTLDFASFENAIALGITPVGTVVTEFSAHFSDLPKETVNIGKAGEPNLESILALKPDLILGLDHHQTLYTQAQQIAPTVLLQFEHSGQWKEVFHAFGTVLNREAIAQQVMANYDQRLQEFKRRLAEEKSSPPLVSVIRVYPEKINIYLRDSFPGTIVQDAGLPRPPSQNLSAAEAQKIANNPIQMSISRELLPEADGDVMFLWTGENTLEASQQAKEKLAALKSDPLWQKLKVVKENKVYQVPSYWIGSGPMAANAVIDDLFKYLLDSGEA